MAYQQNSGTALSMYPRVQRVYCNNESTCAAIGDTIQFQIRTNPDVKNYVNPRDSTLTAAQYAITFDPTAIEIVSITQGPVFQQNGDESIFTIDYDNSNGTLSIITARLGNYPLDESGIFSTINFGCFENCLPFFVVFLFNLVVSLYSPVERALIAFSGKYHFWFCSGD